MPALCHNVLVEAKGSLFFFPMEFISCDPVSFCFNKASGVHLDQGNLRALEKQQTPIMLFQNNKSEWSEPIAW